MHRSFRNLVLVAGMLTACLSAEEVLAVLITNPSFEVAPSGGFPAFPGYAPNGANPNTYIPGWSSTSPDAPQARVGINGANSTALANNGTIPDGAYVAFIQSPGPAATLSQTLPALTLGTQYTLTFYDNARLFGVPHLTVTLGAHGLLSDAAVTPVGGTNPYNFVSLSFVADAGDTSGPTLTFSVTGPNNDDTLLLDNVALNAVPEPSCIMLLGTAGLIILGKRRRSIRYNCEQ